MKNSERRFEEIKSELALIKSKDLQIMYINDKIMFCRAQLQGNHPVSERSIRLYYMILLSMLQSLLATRLTRKTYPVKGVSIKKAFTQSNLKF